MKAIILAAGRGSRMKNLTERNPKCLVELHGKSLLDRQLDALNMANIEDISIVTGYRREMLIRSGLREFHNPRWAETNMVSSLECAKDWLKEGPCIVSYSDIFYRSTAICSLVSSSEPLAVTYDPNWLDLWSRRFNDPLIDAESFRLGNKHILLEIGKKPKSVDDVQGQYMGLLRFTPKGWGEVDRIRKELTQQKRDKMHMTETLQMVIEAKRFNIQAVEYKSSWGEIDSEDDLKVYSASSYNLSDK